MAGAQLYGDVVGDRRTVCSTAAARAATDPITAIGTRDSRPTPRLVLTRVARTPAAPARTSAVAARLSRMAESCTKA